MNKIIRFVHLYNIQLKYPKLKTFLIYLTYFRFKTIDG